MPVASGAAAQAENDVVTDNVIGNEGLRLMDHGCFFLSLPSP